MQLGSHFSFWIKTQKKKKKKNVKCFPLVPNPRWGALGVGFSMSPPKCAFLEKEEVKNEG